MSQVVVVSGGAGGIGGATVARFVAGGARVVFTDWDEVRGAEQAASFADADNAPVFVPADVRDEAACANVVATAVREFGRIDVLVNNAAVRNYQTVVEADMESWRRVLDVNLMGYVNMAKVAIVRMSGAGGGNIVNVASICSNIARSKTVQYDTTKAAILGLTRSMARDHAAEGIRVNAVGPGPIFTHFHAGRAAELGQTDDQYRERFGADTLLKRPGTPDEVAAAICFLASDDASFITGTCLFVDGGLTAFAEG